MATKMAQKNTEKHGKSQGEVKHIIEWVGEILL